MKWSISHLLAVSKTQQLQGTTELITQKRKKTSKTLKRLNNICSDTLGHVNTLFIPFSEMFCTCSVTEVKWTRLQGIFGVFHCPWKSEFGATNYIWVDTVLVVSLKSKMDTFIFVISVALSPYGHVTGHYMLVCVWNHNNGIWTYVQVDRLSARLFNGTKTEQTTNKPNAQLSIKSNKGGSRILLQAQGCRGSSNFLT